MDPLTALLGMSLITGLFGGVGSGVSSAEARKQRKFASREAEKQRDWMEHMSNTAHQREVADLRSAGLNPILSSGGSGASVSGGASASAPAVPDTSQKILDAGLAIGNFIMSAARLDNENKIANAQETLSAMQTEKTSAEKELIGLQAEAQQIRNNLLPDVIGSEVNLNEEKAADLRNQRDYRVDSLEFERLKHRDNYAFQKDNLAERRRENKLALKRLNKEIEMSNRDRDYKYKRLEFDTKKAEAELNTSLRGQNIGFASSLIRSLMSVVPMSTAK